MIGRRRVGTRQPWTPVRRRLVGSLVVYALLFGGVGYRLVDIQVVHADAYAQRGEQQRAREVELPARRGRLYDRDGEVLATSVDAATVYADPRAFRPRETADGLLVPPAADADEVAATLAPLLGRAPEELAERLRRDAHFVYLARQLDWEVGERVAALELPGIGILTEPHRVYPGGALAGQILGFTGIDGEGLHGLELQHESLLAGRPGRLVLEQAPGGLEIASGTRQLEPPRPGSDLVLTIDRDIQHAAERAAVDAVEAFSARGAGVVVLEVGTGDVLAMASVPGFDPNDLTSADPEAWRNRTVTDVFEPGSVQKAVTAAAALEEGIVRPETRLLVPDRIRVSNKTFSDAHDHPTEELTFAEVMQTSSNVGTIMVAQDLGAERLADWLHRFGYGRRLGIGFPGEAPGLLPRVEDWWGTSLPTIAIGQGVATTLLQLASVYETIADDGIATQPRILRGTVGEDGLLAPASPGATHRVLSADTARAIREILAGVVADGGTGTAARVPGYTVAGKTGTARKPAPDARGYSDEYVASFVGLAPAEAPRLVVAVMVDEPRPIWGGVVAAPIFSEVMEFALKHRRVPPTAPVGPLAEALDDAARQAAEYAARAEGPATSADAPGSPPVGQPAGGPPPSPPSAGAGGTAPSDDADPSA